MNIDWDEVEGSLLERGYASLGDVLTAEQCSETIALWDEPGLFRSRIDMARYRFGVGEYRYFGYPLPVDIARLRTALYEPLARIANPWMQLLKTDARFPASHGEFIERCHAAGQRCPTPLLLRYEREGYNRLHQDLYGAIYFPFQVIVQLTQPEVDFSGGQLLMVEQLPRAQSIGQVLTPQRGEAVAITTRHRPAKSKTGYYKTNARHGVSRVIEGKRWTLGIIFHDAEG